MYVVDWRIVALCSTFFVLSIIMSLIINRLKKFSWTFASVWGIFWIVTGVAIFAWRARGEMWWLQAWVDLFLVFACALPPLAIMEYAKYKRESFLEQRSYWLERQIEIILREQAGTNHKLERIEKLLTEQQVGRLSVFEN